MIVKNITPVQWDSIFIEVPVVLTPPIGYDAASFVTEWMLQHSYRRVFDYTELVTLEDIKQRVESVLSHSKPYLDAVLASVTTEFNPMDLDVLKSKTIDKTVNSGNVVTTKTGTDTTTAGQAATTSVSAYDAGLSVSDEVRNSGNDVVAYDTNDTVADGRTVDDTSDYESTGHSNIDYVNAIAAIYRTKSLIWYSEVYNIIARSILMPSYSFDDDEVL